MTSALFNIRNYLLSQKEIILYSIGLIFSISLFSFELIALNSISLIVLFLFWLLVLPKHFQIKTIQTQLLLGFIGFYLWEIITLIYSTDIQRGLSVLQVNVAIFFIPLIFFGSKNIFSISLIHRLLITFVVISFIAICGSVVYAMSHYLQNKDYGVFFNAGIIPEYMGINRNTYALFLLLSMGILFNYVKNIKTYIYCFPLIVGLILFEMMLGSRLSFVVAIFLFIAVHIYWFYKKVVPAKIVSIVAIVVVIVFTFVFLKISNFNADRLLNVWNGFTHKDISQEGTVSAGEPRQLIWESTIQIIKHNFFLGVGVGDSKNELIQQYANDKWLNYDGVNAHNDFLQSWLVGGIVLFSLLVWIFFLLYKNLWNSHTQSMFLAYAVLLIGTTCFMTIECVFETNQRMVFFLFFTGLLSQIGFLKNNNLSKTK